jgi:hypothetical protein
MSRRLTILAGILAFGLMLGGCSKCDPWWGSSLQACKNELPK